LARKEQVSKKDKAFRKGEGELKRGAEVEVGGGGTGGGEAERGTGGTEGKKRGEDEEGR
jgi:hypothetical protein